MSNYLPPIPQTPISETFQWRDWLRNLGTYIQVAQVGGSPWTIPQGGTGASTASGARANLGLGTMATQNSNAVSITGGSVVWSAITSFPHIEVYDLSSNIPLTATPTILAPASISAGSNGITYSSSTGVFTFASAGSYSLALAVNAIATAAGQFVYIYAENWNGSAWIPNTNSGKIYELINNQITQIVYSQAVYRTAGQQVRYQIYSNGVKVALQTSSMPSVTGVYVPAIRVQYS